MSLLWQYTDFKDIPIAAFLKKMEVFAEHTHLKIAAKAQQILKDALQNRHKNRQLLPLF